ncbi:transposase family protein, partial [Trichothermofontia sp.]
MHSGSRASIPTVRLIDLLNEAATCPYCQTSSHKLHQNRPVFVRDLAIFGRPAYLRIPRRQF